MSSDVDLGGVFKARSVKVVARVERKDGKLLGTGAVQVSGATLNDTAVEINEQGLMVKGQPAGQTPDGSALLSALAERGISVIPPRVEVTTTEASVGVKVFAPALRIVVSSEQPYHEVDVIGLESGYATAAMTGGAEEPAGSAPTDYADLYQPPSDQGQAAAPPAMASAADESAGVSPAAGGGIDDTASRSSSGYPSSSSSSSSSYTTDTGALAGPGISDAGSSVVPGAGAQLAAGTVTPAQTIGSVRPAGLRKSVKALLVAVWAASMVALVAAGAWQRGAGSA
jgi:hypothetical protein